MSRFQLPGPALGPPPNMFPYWYGCTPSTVNVHGTTDQGSAMVYVPTPSFDAHEWNGRVYSGPRTPSQCAKGECQPCCSGRQQLVGKYEAPGGRKYGAWVCQRPQLF